MSEVSHKNTKSASEIPAEENPGYTIPWALYVCICSLIGLAWAAEIFLTPSQPTIINVFAFLFLVLCAACATYGEISLRRENSSRRQSPPHPGYSDDDVPALDMYVGALKHVDTIFEEDPTRKLTGQQEQDIELVRAAAQLPLAHTPPPFHRLRAQTLRKKLYELLIDAPAVDDDGLVAEIVDRRSASSSLFTEQMQCQPQAPPKGERGSATTPHPSFVEDA